MIRLVVPAQQAKPGPPLSPVLGQHQIKPTEFIPQFNAASAGYTPGTPLGVRISKMGPKWTFQVAPPTVGILLSGVTHSGRVDRIDLWGVLLQRGNATPRGAKTLLGVLRSLGVIPR